LKSPDTLSQGGHATATVWRKKSDHTFEATTEEIEVYDWLLKVGATAIATGKKIVGLRLGTVGVVLEAECA
jgi:hypothetical protein